MARPIKKPSERKTAEIRIPLTPGQKSLILKAAAMANLDVATWARPIVLVAAANKAGAIVVGYNFKEASK